MKKKGYVFAFILGAAICGGLVYADGILNAKDVLYAPNNNDFHASTVKEALDTLYSKADSDSQYDFTYSVSSTFDTMQISINGNENFYGYF